MTFKYIRRADSAVYLLIGTAPNRELKQFAIETELGEPVPELEEFWERAHQHAR